MLPPGPAWDNRSARDAGVISEKSISRASRSTGAMAARCHPRAKSPKILCSLMRGGRAPSARASHEGGRNPWCVRAAVARFAAVTDGHTLAPPCRAGKMLASKWGWRDPMTGKESAQEAQCAAAQDAVAARRPSPPKCRGSCAWPRGRATLSPQDTPRSCVRHRSTSLSCAAA